MPWLVRGRFQTIFGKINVIMMFRGEGGQGLDVYFVHYSLNCGSDRVAAVANGRK